MSPLGDSVDLVVHRISNGDVRILDKEDEQVDNILQRVYYSFAALFVLEMDWSTGSSPD